MKNRNIQVKLYNPTPPQLKALDVLHGKKPFITLLNFGRQTGKSYMALMEALGMGIANAKWRIMFLTPTYMLASKHIQTIQSIFEDNKQAMELIFKPNGIKTKSQELHLSNGTIIVFRSAEQGDALRGDTINFAFVDEAAFIPKSVLTEIVMPMLTRTKGRLCIISTPNGRNWFYDLFNDGQKPENADNIISIRADYRDLDDEDVTKVIMQMKKNMTSAEFAREVLGEFVSDASLFNNVEGRIFPENHIPDMLCDRYIGIDIGVVNDYTVLTCINRRREVIDIDRFNMKEENLTYKEYIDRIKAFILKHDNKLVAAYFEINNKDLLYDELTSDERMRKVEAFNTNVASKPKMINHLIKLFEDEEILIPDNNILIAELYAYSSKTNPITGKVQYQNVGEAHDDTVSSLALAAWCLHEETDGGVTEFL